MLHLMKERARRDGFMEPAQENQENPNGEQAAAAAIQEDDQEQHHEAAPLIQTNPTPIHQDNQEHHHEPVPSVQNLPILIDIPRKKRSGRRVAGKGSSDDPLHLGKKVKVRNPISSRTGGGPVIVDGGQQGNRGGPQLQAEAHANEGGDSYSSYESTDTPTPEDDTEEDPTYDGDAEAASDDDDDYKKQR